MAQVIDRFNLLFNAHAVARKCRDAAGLFNCAKDNAHSPRRALSAQLPPRSFVLLRSITDFRFLHHVHATLPDILLWFDLAIPFVRPPGGSGSAGKQPERRADRHTADGPGLS